MKIEIWSDIACPFCYIGKKKLEEALSDFPHSNQVDIEFKSYQLAPDAENYSGQSYYESLAAKFGSGIEQAKEMTLNIAEHAKQTGLSFNFDHIKATNTFDAHRLIHHAKKHGKSTEMAEKLFQAHFTDGIDVSNIDELVILAKEIGLNETEAKNILKDKEVYGEDVAFDISEAKKFGITGVPYFIFNRKYAISGAQPKEAFLQALEKVAEEENITPVFENINMETDASCTDDGCEIPQQEKN